MPINPAALLGILADQIATCDDATYAEARQTLADFERAHAPALAAPPATDDAAERLSEYLADAHLQLLTALRNHRNPDAAEPHLEALRRLHEQHPDNRNNLQDYASALSRLHDGHLTAASADADDSTDDAAQAAAETKLRHQRRAAELHATLQTLAARHPAHDLSGQLAETLYDQFYAQLVYDNAPEAAAATQAQLHALHAARPASPAAPYITKCCASAYLTWITHYLYADNLPEATAAYATLETFIAQQTQPPSDSHQSHTSLPPHSSLPSLESLPSLPPRQPLSPKDLRALHSTQTLALTRLIEAHLEPSNTGDTPEPTPPATVAAAETYYATLRALCAAHADDAAPSNFTQRQADAAIALFNHYHLAAAPARAPANPDALRAAADAKFEDLLTLAAADPDNADPQYAKALYAITNAAAESAPDTAPDFDKAERHHKILKLLAEHSLTHSGKNAELLTTYLAYSHATLAHGYGDAHRLPEAQRHIDALARLYAAAPAPTAKLIATYARALYNLNTCYIEEHDLPATAQNHTTLRALYERHPQNPSALENYADATAGLANAHTDARDYPAADADLATLRALETALTNNSEVLSSSSGGVHAAPSATPSALQPFTPSALTTILNPLSLLLYNYVMEYTTAATQNLPAAETKYAELQQLLRRHPARANIALRAAIAALQLFRCYNERNDLPRADPKYRDLQHLTATYADAPADESRSAVRLAEQNTNPLGLEIALRQAPVASTYLSALTIKNKKHLPLIAALLTDLQTLAARWPANPTLADIYAENLTEIASAHLEANDYPSADKLLAPLSILSRTRDAAPDTPDNPGITNSYSLLLYNYAVRYLDAKNTPAAEQAYVVLQNILRRHPQHHRTALRAAKAAFLLVTDYSEAADYARADQKYHDLQTLAHTYATAPADHTENPIALEIAIRQTNAARNFAIDLKTRNHPLRIQRTTALYADTRPQAHRWPLAQYPASKPIHDTLAKLATLLPTLPPAPPPLPFQQPPPLPPR